MAEVITRQGERRIAQCQGRAQVLPIDQFVLSYDPALDPTAAIDREAPLPPAQQIVHTQGVYKAAFIGPSQVIYTLMLDSNVGPFQFNRIDLMATNSNIAISTLPTRHKASGEILCQNLLIAYDGSEAITSVNIDAADWNLESLTRLQALDQLGRVSNRDIWGRSCFWGDGFKVTGAGNDYQLSTGQGYVEGIRIQSDGSTLFTADTLPINVWLDVSLQGDSSGVQPMVEVVLPEIPLTDGRDEQQVYHFLEEIASIDADGNITDLRNSKPVVNSLAGYIDRYPLLNDPTMADNRADAMASQQAVKGYADANIPPRIAACSVRFPNWPNGPSGAYFFSKTGLISQLTVVDNNTVVIHLSEPMPGAIPLVSIVGYKPEILPIGFVCNVKMISDTQCLIKQVWNGAFNTVHHHLNILIIEGSPSQ